MVKLAVRYDNSLKDNVFVIRDDETYVSSTKTILTVSDPVLEEEYDYLQYGVDITINVLRETGTSKVVLYDGDDILDTFDWNGTMISTHYDFPVGTSHTLYARFMGNRQCLKSKSKSFNVFMEATSYDTHITYQGTGSDGKYVIGRTTSFSFVVEDSNSNPIDEGSLVVSYTDGVHNGVQSVTVSNGVATVDFGADFDSVHTGVFNIDAVYEGTDRYTRAELEFQVSKLYTVTLDGYFEYTSMWNVKSTTDKYIRGQNYVLVGSFTDFFGNPYQESAPVQFEGYSNGSWVVLDESTVGDDGKCSFTLTPTSHQGESFTKFRFGTGDSYGFDEFNPIITPEVIEVQSLTVTPSVIATSSTQNVFSVTANGVSSLTSNSSLSGVPVIITNTSIGIDDVYFTNSEGKVECKYSPNLSETGSVLNITCGSVLETYTLRYVLTEFVAPNWSGQELGIFNVVASNPLREFRLYTSDKSTGAIYANIPKELRSVKQRFAFTVVMSNLNAFIYAVNTGSGNSITSGDPQQIWVNTHDIVEFICDPTDNSFTCRVNNRELFKITTPNYDVYYPALIKVNENYGNVMLNNIIHEVIP